MREPEGIVGLTEWARVTTQFGKDVKNGREHSWGTLFIWEWRRFVCVWVKVKIVIFCMLEIWHGQFHFSDYPPFNILCSNKHSKVNLSSLWNVHELVWILQQIWYSERGSLSQLEGLNLKIILHFADIFLSKVTYSTFLIQSPKGNLELKSKWIKIDHIYFRNAHSWICYALFIGSRCFKEEKY